jgi:capsular exopolysaccharide synthesis family protein
MNNFVPSPKLLNSKFLITLSDYSAETSEAIRELRTHVMARHVQQGHRALAVCAASEEVGCTFVAANLAVALSQIGVNTLLIDADMRNPSLAKVFNYSAPKGDLKKALSSDMSFNDCIEADILPCLSILLSTDPVADAQELLAGTRFEALMNYCLREFDATIVDTPPANIYSDVRRICTVVGYSLIVTRRNKSLISDVKHLMEQLRGDHAEVIGTVLNEA